MENMISLDTITNNIWANMPYLSREKKSRKFLILRVFPINLVGWKGSFEHNMSQTFLRESCFRKLCSEIENWQIDIIGLHKTCQFQTMYENILTSNDIY